MEESTKLSSGAQVSAVLICGEPDATAWETGDRFRLQFQPQFLELDYLYIDNRSRACFDLLFPSESVSIIIPGVKRTSAKAKVDRQSKSLSWKGLGKHLKFLSGCNQVVLAVASLDPLSFEVIPPAVTGYNETDLDIKIHSPADALVLQPGWEQVLAAIDRGTYCGEPLYRSHEEASALDLCQPLDRLISLANLPDLVPYPHQVQAVKTTISKLRGRALLCDEVGLGKTIEAGLILLEYMLRGMVQKVLILTPPSLSGQWQEELRHKFGLDFVVNDEGRFKGWDAHPLIIGSLSKAKLSPHCQQLAEIDFDLVIVDEAHHLRNRNTKSWQLVDRLKKRYILFLTATPIQNSLSDLYSLVTVLKPGHLKTYAEFKRQFTTSNEYEPKNLDRLRALLQTVMIRNKRSHTNLILSKRHAKTVQLDLHPDESAFYQRVTALVRRGAFRKAGDPPIVDQLTLQHLQLEAGSSVPACLLGLERLSRRDLPQAYKNEVAAVLDYGAKLKVRYSDICRKAQITAELVRTFNDKLIVFSRFSQTHDFIAGYLKQQGIEAVSFHGGMKRMEKDAIIQEFKDSAQVLVCSEAGGEGRNLQFCRALINYDLPWNPMRIEQRVGRIHRLGQDRDVHIFNLAAKGTAESYVLELLDKKINLFELVVGELDMILGDLDENKEFEELMFEIWTDSQDDAEVAGRLEELGRRLAGAKAQYLQSQEFDDKVFGDALTTA
ncbi:MAG TPA: SNF2-related protein [Candidatus Obscuribacterales bacterium]